MLVQNQNVWKKASTANVSYDPWLCEESTCQVLGHLAGIEVCHKATEVWYFHTLEIGFQG